MDLTLPAFNLFLFRFELLSHAFGQLIGDYFHGWLSGNKVTNGSQSDWFPFVWLNEFLCGIFNKNIWEVHNLKAQNDLGRVESWEDLRESS